VEEFCPDGTVDKAFPAKDELRLSGTTHTEHTLSGELIADSAHKRMRQTFP
jgi:hypothetical protein